MKVEEGDEKYQKNKNMKCVTNGTSHTSTIGRKFKMIPSSFQKRGCEGKRETQCSGRVLRAQA